MATAATESSAEPQARVCSLMVVRIFTSFFLLH
uniref:Uncharacterized protein n=1 Tax=Parascaris equorum TaxID=6256 RepID=A0A914RI58_PAREQ